MTFAEFKTSVQNGDQPPETLSPVLRALWHAGKGSWDQSHQVAQEIHSSDGSWVHAYLHRQEGDLSNADYWYNRCKRSRPSVTLETEWEQISKTLLGEPV